MRSLGLVTLFVCIWTCPLSAQIQEHSAELETHTGVVDGNYSLGGGLQYNVTRCLGLRSTADAVVDAGGRSQLLASANVLYGLWYCCIPSYYVRFVYFTAGAGTFHRMGRGRRTSDPSVNAGLGARISLNEKMGLSGEITDFIVLGEDARKHLWALRLGLHFIL